MKNLATCTPSEFFKQAVKVKRAAEKWMKDVNFLEIRARFPELVKIEKDMSQEEKEKAFKENRARVKKAGVENAMEIFDKAFDEHADETLAILGYCFFIEPEEVDNYQIRDYLRGITEILSDPEVIDFFTSVGQLGLINSRKASET